MSEAPKPEERKPLSDSDIDRIGHEVYWSIENYNLIKVRKALDGYVDAKITSGELMAVKTTNSVFGKEFSCQQCHGRILKTYTFCPGCGAKIIP